MSNKILSKKELMEEVNQRGFVIAILTVLLVLSAIVIVYQVITDLPKEYNSDESYIKSTIEWSECIDDPSNYWDNERGCRKKEINPEGESRDLDYWERLDVTNLPRYLQTNGSIKNISECNKNN